MGERFTASDAARLEAAIAALLSTEASARDADAWLDAVRGRLAHLIRADRSTLVITSKDRSIAGVSAYRTDLDPAAVRAYEERYHAQDVGTLRMFRRGLDLVHQWDVVSPEELRSTEYYNEWFRAHALHDAIVMSSGEPGVPGGWISFHHHRPLDDRGIRRALGLLRAVKPAFRVGVDAWRRRGRALAALDGMLDVLPEGVLLCDRSGRPLHENPAFFRITGSDAQRLALRNLAAGIARSVSATASSGRRRGAGDPFLTVPERTARFGQAAYRLRGVLVEETLFASEPLVMVSIERSAPAPLSDAELRERYGLTRRECVVARLAATGMTNEEIADRLFISPFTARNHVERLLRKLGLPRRARIAPLLHGLAVEDCDPEAD